MADTRSTPKSRHRKPASPASGAKTRSKASSSTGPVAIGLDKTLLYVTIALAILGLAAVYSASATEALDVYGNSLYFVQRQFVFFVMGFGLMYLISHIPFFAWSRWTRVLAFIVIGFLAYTLHSGVEAYGAERWIRILGFQFQPSELGKISIVLLLAQALGQKAGTGKGIGFFFNIGLILVTLLLIYKQPSLSMTIILFTISIALLYVARIPTLLLAATCGIGGAYAGYKLLHTEYQLRRIQGWLDPWKDAQDTGYNLIQSLYAIGSGGIIGTGLGMSHQKLYYLPFQYTDFIFSVWAEEWGFLGSFMLLGFFVTLLYRGVVISKTCRSPFGQLLAMGITLILAFQVIINLSVATGLFPVTGVTLPLISYGGTSVVVTLIMIGILLNISRYRVTVSSISRYRPL